MDRRPVALVLIAGTLFGLCVPFSKALMDDMEPIMLTGFLYAGAAAAMGSLFFLGKMSGRARDDARMTRSEKYYMTASILVGAVAAPISLMIGLSLTAGSDASLLLNLEGVMTAIVAVSFFHDKGGRKLWLALAAMTIASTILSYGPESGFGGNGSVLIVLAMAMWGLDNNLMKKVAHHDPAKLSFTRNATAALIILSLAVLLDGGLDLGTVALATMLIGAISYGLSNAIFFYGLRHLGPSRTGTLFSVGPYAAAMAAIPLLGEPVTVQLVIAGLLMAAGTLLLTSEKKGTIKDDDAGKIL